MSSRQAAQVATFGFLFPGTAFAKCLFCGRSWCGVLPYTCTCAQSVAVFRDAQARGCCGETAAPPRVVTDEMMREHRRSAAQGRHVAHVQRRERHSVLFGLDAKE